MNKKPFGSVLPAVVVAILAISLSSAGFALQSTDTPEIAPAIRAARSRAFNDTTGMKPRLDVEPPAGRGYGGYTDFAAVPPLPAQESAAIIVARCAGSEAFFSEDRTSVYTESTVRVEEVLKPGAKELKAEDLIAALSLGGTKRLASGRTVKGLAVQPGTPLSAGQRYVLFLRYHAEGDYYTIVKPWEIRNGRVFPLSHEDIRDARNHRSPFANLDEPAFIDAVKRAISQQ